MVGRFGVLHWFVGGNTMVGAHDKAPRHWALASGLGLFAVIAVLGLIYFSEYVRAWLLVEAPTQSERLNAFNLRLDNDGATALMERSGEVLLLRRGDISQIGSSQCEREYSCQKAGRRAGCSRLSVQFNCTYAVKDMSGQDATAILVLLENDSRSEDESLLRYHPSLGDRLTSHALRLDETKAKLCALGWAAGATGTRQANVGC